MSGVGIDAVQLRSLIAAWEAARDEVFMAHRELVSGALVVGQGGGRVASAPIEEAAGLLDRLLGHQARIGFGLEELLGALLAADTPMACPPLPLLPAPPSRPVVWLADRPDSWVVDLFRSPVDAEARGRLARRLVDDGPGVARTLIEAAIELSPLTRATLAPTDPAGLAGDWLDLARGAGASLRDLAVNTAPLLAVPLGLEPLAWVATGRSPTLDALGRGADLVEAVAVDPDQVVAELLRWDELEHEPYRWLGGFAPDVLLALPGTGLVPRGPRLLRAVRIVGELDGPVPAGGRLDLRLQRQLEPEWGPAGPIVSHRLAPFESPRGWVDDINGGGVHDPGRATNCIDCARAVEANWRGADAVAAPLRPSTARGTSLDRLEDWTGAALRPTTLDEIEARLTELGPGSSALVASTWDSGGAHAYNAVNDAGTVTWVDAQLGDVGRWPPRYASSVDQTLAIFIGPDGQPR